MRDSSQTLANRRRIGVFINYPESGPYQREFLAGVHQAAVAKQADLLVFGVGNLRADRQDEVGSVFLDYLRSDFLDGAILLTGSLAQYAGAERKAELAASPVPMVSVGDLLDGVPSIVLDNMAGFAQLMDHLFIEHGYKSPAFLAGPMSSWDSNDRLRVYKQSLARHGLEDNPDLIVHGDFTLEAGSHAVQRLIDELGHKPDVLVCANDQMAIGASWALGLRGLTIPISGFDAVEISPWLESPVTSVRQPLERTGREALELILDRVEGRPIEPLIRYVPTELVIRTTCGCSVSIEQRQQVAAHVENEILAAVVLQEKDRNDARRLSDFAREFLKEGRLDGHLDSERDLVHRLGVKFLQISLLKRPGTQLSGESQLFVAWSDGRPQLVPERGLPYASRDLFPDDYAPMGRQTLLVTVLEDASELLGLVITNYGVTVDRLDRFRNSLTESIVAFSVNQKLEKLNADLREAQAKLEALSLSDELTGHLNRRGFLTMAERMMSYLRRKDQPFLVLFLDLDGLKMINDNYGHDEGDEAIRNLGEVLRKTFRATDVVARLGGDEFTVMAVDAVEEGLDRIKERMNALVAQTNRRLARPWSLSFSLGAYLSNVGSTARLSEMMEHADRALYEEKRAKKKVQQPG